jgi:hypothetical protein
MPVTTPYRRTCRQFADGGYSTGGAFRYICHPKYAKSPEQYIRAFLILQKDFQDLFEYVEPANANLSCHSYRIFALLLRTCVEIEANCKAILRENGFEKRDNWNMGDYQKIEGSHLLSGYNALVPVWHGNGSIRAPFSGWSEGAPLPWYAAYNKAKHDRHSHFADASFESLLDAICGLAVLVSAQFYVHDFAVAQQYVGLSSGYAGYEVCIGDFLHIKYPEWPVEQRYAFDSLQLMDQDDPFSNYPY